MLLLFYSEKKSQQEHFGAAAATYLHSSLHFVADLYFIDPFTQQWNKTAITLEKMTKTSSKSQMLITMMLSVMKQIVLAKPPLTTLYCCSVIMTGQAQKSLQGL